MASYKDDPRWLTARYPGCCAGCKARTDTGQRLLYYPKGKVVFCRPCGDPRYREFLALAADEDNYAAGYC